MDKKNLSIAIFASILIGILAVPTAGNLPLPGFLANLGANSVGIILAVLGIAGYIFTEFLGRFMSAFRQLGRFAIVGVLNTVLDFAILNVLISTSGISEGTTATVFKGIAFIVAVVNSYYWNKHWTFEFKAKVDKEFLQFFVVSVIGFVLNIGAFATVVNLIGAPGGFDQTAWANLGALAGTFAGLAWNFIGYKFIVFKRK